MARRIKRKYTRHVKVEPVTIDEQKEEAFGILSEVEKSTTEEFKEYKQRKEAESKERIPGKIVNGTKILWTRKDIADRFPIVSFIPEETVPVSFNGVKYQLLGGAINHVPSVIRDQYYVCKQKAQRAGSKLTSSGYVNTIDLGAGALKPE